MIESGSTEMLQFGSAAQRPRRQLLHAKLIWSSSGIEMEKTNRCLQNESIKLNDTIIKLSMSNLNKCRFYLYVYVCEKRFMSIYCFSLDLL